MQHSFYQIQPYLPFLIPLTLVEIALVVYCLFDIQRRDRHVRGGNKIIWRIIVIVFTTVGSLMYLFWGREDL